MSKKELKLPPTNKLFKEGILSISYSQVDTFLSCPHKWQRHYVWGEVDEKKQEALSYGSVIHRTLEQYFLSSRTMSFQDVVSVLNAEWINEQIPFVSRESEKESYYDAAKFIKWMIDEASDLPEYALLKFAEIVGVEEDFKILHPLPERVAINGAEYDEVQIVGSIDLKVQDERGDIHLIDHKSGRTLFKKNKLLEDLQFPIYAAQTKLANGEYPKSCTYNFTRKREFQSVAITQKRMDAAAEKLNAALLSMYSGDRSSQKGNPTPLCFWCPYGFYNNRTCTFSSRWKPA